MCVCTWNPNGALVLNGKGVVLGGLTFKNRGHSGSKYTYMCVSDFLVVAPQKIEGVSCLGPKWLK